MPEPFKPTDEFLREADAAGLVFDADDLRRLGLYLALLHEANQSFNLTAVRDPEEMWIRHVLDSLTLLPLLADLPEQARIIDIGSGGGAPGLIVAVAQPGSHLTLVEATGKKARFLERASAEIGLTNVTVLQERAETLAHRPELRAGFDAALARAVGRIAVIAELTVPFVRVGGLILLTKGQHAEEELAEAKQALHMLHATVAGVVPTPTGRIVVVEKRRATPRTYPRRPGEPARAPLGLSAVRRAGQRAAGAPAEQEE